MLAKTIRVHLFLVFVVAACLVLAVGCGTQYCKESCQDNEDCRSGLKCLDTTKHGRVCIPRECQTCFDRQQRCVWSEDYGDPEEEKRLECGFLRCE